MLPYPISCPRKFPWADTDHSRSHPWLCSAHTGAFTENSGDASMSFKDSDHPSAAFSHQEGSRQLRGWFWRVPSPSAAVEVGVPLPLGHFYQQELPAELPARRLPG